MKKLFFLLLSLIFFNLYAATLLPIEEKSISEGKLFDAKLKFDPSEKEIEKSTAFQEFFFLVSTDPISENESKLRLVLKKIPPTVFVCKINEKDFSLSILDFNFVANENKDKTYLLKDQKSGFYWESFLKEHMFAIIIILFVLIATLLFFIFSSKKRKEKQKRKLLKEYWESCFYAAQTREEFEHIGKMKKQWLDLLLSKPISVTTFFETLEKHQYKKVLTQDELSDLKNALNGMKNVFRNDGI